MRIILKSLLVLLLLTSCSTEPSIQLVSSSVQIKDDRAGGIVTYNDNNQEKTVKLLSLSYTFILKNTGGSVGSASKIKDFEYVDGLKISLVPNEKLQAVSYEIFGFNLYGQEKTMGLGKTGTPILNKNQQAEYTLDYVLGAKEDNPETKIAPSQEKLNKLLNNALDATLIISVDEKELARFDLTKSR